MASGTDAEFNNVDRGSSEKGERTSVLKKWPDVDLGESFCDWMDKVNVLTWKDGVRPSPKTRQWSRRERPLRLAARPFKKDGIGQPAEEAEGFEAADRPRLVQKQRKEEKEVTKTQVWSIEINEEIMA